MKKRYANIACLLVIALASDGLARGLTEIEINRFEDKFHKRVERYFHKRCRNQTPVSIDWESFGKAKFKRRVNVARQCAKPLFKLGGICESDFGWSARNNKKPKKAKRINRLVKRYTCHYGGRGHKQRIAVDQGHLEFWVDFSVSEQDENFRSFLEFMVGERNCHSEGRGQHRHGREVCQNDDGKLTFEGHWKRGLRHGTQKRWTRDGKFLKSEENYQDDIRHGRTRKYNEKDGLLLEEVHYQKGQLHGARKTYYRGEKGGKLESIEHYQNGDRIGKCENYYENGQLRKRGTYGPGSEWIGTYEYYTEKGVLTERSHYAMLPGITRSAYHGKVERFYEETGKPKEVSHYRHGKQHGLEIEYDKSGKAKKACYQDGRWKQDLNQCR